VLDLTASNPTRCGFEYGPILGPLADPAALDYDPDPRGMVRAREAICRYYADHGIGVNAGQLFLTTSTSEAYSFLFRLLCDVGDEVLIAQPSYPLFDFLAALDDVRLVAYPLFYDYGWHLDVDALRRRITPRTRAIVVVNPNNPTGHFTRLTERRELEAVCHEHGFALIVDEVFLDYPIAEETAGSPSFASGEHPVLTFVLSGLSKVAGLPQMKASWIVCLGPSNLCTGAEERLEVIADAFLSMNVPVQCALPVWLEGRAAIQGQIRARLTANLLALDRVLDSQHLIGRLAVEAGWSAVLQTPAIQPDAVTAADLLREPGIAVHSGDLFGFAEHGRLVVSLLSPTSEFEDGIEGICQYFNAL
jgi:alanine-synthesizing transaminase